MKAWLLGILGILATGVAIFFTGKRAGRTEQQNKNNEQVLNNVKAAKDIDDNADVTSDADKRKWLHNNATNK